MNVPKRKQIVNAAAPELAAYSAAPVPSNGAKEFVYDSTFQPVIPIANGNLFHTQFSSRQMRPLVINPTNINYSLLPSGELAGQIEFQNLVNNDNLVSPDGN